MAKFRRGPKLPSDLLTEINSSNDGETSSRGGGKKRKFNNGVSRKDQRKEDRKAKKLKRSNQNEQPVTSLNGPTRISNKKEVKFSKDVDVKEFGDSDSDNFEGFDSNDESDGDDDDITADDTWAALKKLKDAKNKKTTKSSSASPKVKSLKKVNHKNDSDEENDNATAEDTWAALKKLKESKNKPSTKEDSSSKKKENAIKKSKKPAKSEIDSDIDDDDDDDDDDEATVEDTWAALKKLKDAKTKKTPAFKENSKSSKSKKQVESDDDFDEGDDNATAEDTWAALKKLKEAKNKTVNSKKPKLNQSDADDTMERLKQAKENKKKLEKDSKVDKKIKKETPKKKEEPQKKGRSLADLLKNKGDSSSASKHAESSSTERYKSKIPKNVTDDQKALFRKDDEDIAFYTRMLGMKDPNDPLPNAGEEDDGLGDLLDGLDLDFGDYDEDDEDAPQFAYGDGNAAEEEPDLVEESDSDEFNGFNSEEEDEGEDESDIDVDTKLPFSSDDELDSDDFDSDPPSDIDMKELQGIDDSDESDSDESGDENDLDSVKDEDSEGESDANEDSEDEEEDEAPKRENPYVAPVTSTQKYIPPSVRHRMETEAAANNGISKTSIQETEDVIRLRRQIKGQINRLTDTNIAGIVKTLSDMYLNNPRQYMNEIITSTIVESVALQGALSDKFLAVHAALVAALYRTSGLEFVAHFVQTLVEEFDKRFYDKNGSVSKPAAKSEDADGGTSNKEASNLISLLAELYSFNIVWCGIVYDFVREFLKSAKEEAGGNGLDENKTEILLRILRSSGSQLRSDDPRALRDIVIQLNEVKAGAAQSGAQLSSRTLFMIGFIEDLKNNKQKRSGDAAEIAKEARKRMRDFINANVKAPKRDPLRVSLDDIRNVATRGKWWLVGSAWRSNNMVGEDTQNSELGNQEQARPEDFVDQNAMKDILDSAAPDWVELARTMRMNTDIRRALFFAIMDSGDYINAVERVQQLKLKSKQEREIARVLLQCCTSEKFYNPFYALLAARLCSAQRALAKTFAFCLYDFLGETEGEDSDDEREGVGRLMDGDDGANDSGSDDEFGDGGAQKIIAMKQARRRAAKAARQQQRDAHLSPQEQIDKLLKVVHMAKLYGTLVALGVLPLNILKTANMVAPAPDTSVFLDLFFTTLFLQVASNGGVGMPGSSKASQKKTSKMGVGLATAMFERKLDLESERGLIQLVAHVAGVTKKKKKARKARSDFSDDEREQEEEKDNDVENSGFGLLRKMSFYLPRLLTSETVEQELEASVASKKSQKLKAKKLEESRGKLQWSVSLLTDAIKEILEREDGRRGSRF